MYYGKAKLVTDFSTKLGCALAKTLSNSFLQTTKIYLQNE
jgi:hypothetical protein